jgi:hypothetical protein
MTPVRLYQGQPGTSEAMLGAAALVKTIVKQIVVANTTATAATLSLSLVPTGGTAGVTNRLMVTHPFAGNTVTTIDLAQVLNVGDFLSALQGTSGALTLTISGLTV